MRTPGNAASEGIAIQHGIGIHADYECICPICGEESGVDDLGAEYQCQVCGNIVIFREENIKIAESGQESIKAMSQEEHKASHRGGDWGTSPAIKWVKDITMALKVLKEYEESELRPADKFLTNTLEQQLQHIEQEFFEVCEALRKYRNYGYLRATPQAEKEWEHLKEELADLKTSCTTMEAIMGMDGADRRAEVRKVNAKNERRNYFDRTE